MGALHSFSLSKRTEPAGRTCTSNGCAPFVLNVQENGTSRTNVHQQWVRSIRSQCPRERDQQYERAPADAFFKVPPVQRKANPQAYEPHMFTFGPYLARFDQQADRFKVQVVQGFRVAEGDFQRLVSAMERHDSEVRELYVDMRGEMVEIDSNTLAWLLAVDSLVIVAGAVNLCGPLHVRNIVAMDAMLLENQVPFFALRHAVETLCPEKSRRPQEVLMNLLNFYYNMLFPNLDNYARLSSLLPSDPADDSGWNKPLLAYIYDALTEQAKISSSTEPDDLSDLDPQLPTSSHLVKYGLTFRHSDTNFTGISFDENTLTLSLPLLVVDDSTQSFILNLLAYEATSTYPSRRCAVVSYLYFMDRLIDSGEDARLLVEAGVIRNHLGSPEELASMWNKMCVFVICSSTSADRKVMKKVIKATQVKRRRWIAAFKETFYEKKPWLIISIVAAFMLLVLTFLQTFYNMKPYFT